ncbi:hypothetical protein MKX08_009216 [Trichoderma sp. CBMAI-0020]|nr:hypothetical protein MKX08_009216 [Trichoderma sp. CBMAI-0020]
MVLIEHLPLLGLALGLAHFHHGRGSHSHPPHLNQAAVPQISDGSSQLHQAPPTMLIAARASDESHDATIQVTQAHLQGILDRIKSLEEEITTVVGGLFREAPINLNQQSTVTITSTTHITRMVTIVPTTIITLTTISTVPVKDSKFKALIPFSSEMAAAIPSKTALTNGHTIRPFNSSLSVSSSSSAAAAASAAASSSSANVETELRQPMTTSLRFNSSMTFHHPSLPKMSGFLTVRRAA